MNASVASRAAHRLEIVGPEQAPIVVVLGGISASRHVTASDHNPERGWWSDFVGEGKAIDTSELRVASMDYRFSEPGGPVSVTDQAAALSRALDQEAIDDVHAVVGTSYGGTVALAFGALEPGRAHRLIVYGAGHESSPAATVCRTLQRRIVELGIRANLGREALALARGLALTTYSTRDEYSRRFGSLAPRSRCEAIERYIDAEGGRFASRVLPERFVEVARSIDLDRIDVSRITVPTTLIGVEEDDLVPPALLRSLAQLIGPHCDVEIVNSPFGHDAFIDDPDCIAGIVIRALTRSEVLS